MTQRPLKTTQTRSAILSTWPGYRVSSVASLWQSCHLLWQWHEGDCDAFQEPKQEFFCLPERWHSLLTPGWALSPASLLPEHSGHQQPSWEFCFCPALCHPHVIASLQVFNASWPQWSKSPTWSYFLVQKKPKRQSHHVCICHSAGFSFSTVTSVPHTTYSGPHDIKLFLGFLSKI